MVCRPHIEDQSSENTSDVSTLATQHSYMHGTTLFGNPARFLEDCIKQALHVLIVSAAAYFFHYITNSCLHRQLLPLHQTPSQCLCNLQDLQVRQILLLFLTPPPPQHPPAVSGFPVTPPSFYVYRICGD